MAAQPQPIYPNELNLAIDRLFARITNSINARFDEVMTQIRIDRQEAQIDTEGIKAEIVGVRTEIEGIKAEQQQTSKRLSDVETFQHAQMDTMKAIALDLSNQMADGFAKVTEALNELKVRVTKLEQQD